MSEGPLFPTSVASLHHVHNNKSSRPLSTLEHISSGVPQGTKLGPILVFILVNDASIDCSRRWKYVDDLTLEEIVK